MKTYIIDGNNLIGKHSNLKNMHKKDSLAARENLIVFLESYFFDSKNVAYVHFDGFEKDKIVSSKIKIIYSDNKSADEKIKSQIINSKNPKNLIIVTSDGNLIQFAKTNSCVIVKSEEFIRNIIGSKKKSVDEKNVEISNNEILKLFLKKD